MTATSDAAQAYLRRNQCYQEIQAHFQQTRPTTADLERVSTAAEVAIDVVFRAHHLDDATCAERHQFVKDYAECATLYGFALGQAAGYAAGLRAAHAGHPHAA